MSKQIFKKELGSGGRNHSIWFFFNPHATSSYLTPLLTSKQDTPGGSPKKSEAGSAFLFLFFFRISIFSSRPCTRIQRTPALLKTKKRNSFWKVVNLANRYVSLQTALVGFQTKETGYRTQSKNIIKWQKETRMIFSKLAASRKD